MPRLGEKFTFESTWEEQLGIESVADPRRDDLADRRPQERSDRTEQAQRATKAHREPGPHDTEL